MLHEVLLRREAIRLFIGAVGFVITSGCSVPSIIFQRDFLQSLERDGDYQPGDVIKYNNSYYLPRNNRYYPIPDIESYARTTKMLQYGRRIFIVKNIGNITLGDLPQYKIELDFLTGVKDIKRGGGEFIDFYAGFGTNEKDETSDITALDINGDQNSGTFFMIRRELKKKGWIFADYHNFNYGASNFYDWEDTGKPLKKSTENAKNFVEENQNTSPLSQRNGIAHSLGTVFLFEVAMEHPDWFNNLILLSPCVRGIEDLIKLPNVILRRYPPLLQDLAKRWYDPDFQKKAKEFVAYFRKIGKRVIEIRSEDDPLSSHIEDAEEYILLPLSGITNPLEAHGRPLQDERVAKYIADIVGGKVA